MRYGYGYGYSLGSAQGVGGGYSPEALAYFAAVPNNTYSDAEKLDLDTFITGLKTDGIWDKIDQLFLLCAKSSTDAESLINLKYPSYPANATPSADPRRAMSIITNGGAELSWQSGIGWTTTSGYDKMSGMYVPDNSYAFKATGAHVMVYTKSNVDAANASLIYADDAGGGRNTLVLRTLTNDTVGVRNCLATQRESTGNTTTSGIYISTMIEDTKLRLYKNGTAIVSNDSHSPASVAAVPITLFYYYNNPGGPYAGSIGMHSLGGALTADESATYNTLIGALLTALGAN